MKRSASVVADSWRFIVHKGNLLASFEEVSKLGRRQESQLNQKRRASEAPVSDYCLEQFNKNVHKFAIYFISPAVHSSAMSEIDKLRQEAEELRSKIRVSRVSMNLSRGTSLTVQVAKWVGRLDYTELACSYSTSKKKKKKPTYCYTGSVAVMQTYSNKNVHTLTS